ncbi:flagellar assembly protein FliH [Phenylobacterium sp.]|uniref:flagellar assembly protein FliH n=1 Tax=Phenylobacterium sp. TaxID=1871053 RepID=UPI0035B469E0
MTQPAPRKFVFDTDFDGPASAAPQRPKRLFPAEEVEQIRAAAYAEGERAALRRMEALQAQALASIADSCRQALPVLAEVAHEHRTGSAGLALACARAIADAALDRFPQAPLQAAVETLAREIESAPRLVVTCPPEFAESAAAALEETAQAIGYAGQIQVRPQTSLTGAFTLDFGDGAASFDPAGAAERVAAALNAALAAEGLHAEPLVRGGDN